MIIHAHMTLWLNPHPLHTHVQPPSHTLKFIHLFIIDHIINTLGKGKRVKSVSSRIQRRLSYTFHLTNNTKKLLFCALRRIFMCFMCIFLPLGYL